jgi:hypothetical protein
VNTWKTTQSLLMLIVLLALATAAGCAATPEDRWFQQRDALNTANRIYLANVPQMTDEQIVHYGELLQTAREQLNEAEAQLPEGGSSFDTMLDPRDRTRPRKCCPGNRHTCAHSSLARNPRHGGHPR